MKRSARVPSQLSASLYQQLHAYTLAASAAGVSVLALTVPADAKIIYTPTHTVIKLHHPYTLSFNGHKEFGIAVSHCSTTACRRYSSAIGIFSLGSGSTARIAAARSTTDSYANFALALKKGAPIPTRRSFRAGVLDGRFCGPVSSSCDSFGRWLPGTTNRYVGLRFSVSGKVHYGWARMSVRSTFHPPAYVVVLTGYAYETIPNKPIVAGKTHGEGDGHAGQARSRRICCRSSAAGAIEPMGSGAS
jgi:hypothetical protein